MKLVTDHTASADRHPCAVETQPWRSQERWNVGCRTHRCQARSSYPDEVSARVVRSAVTAAPAGGSSCTISTTTRLRNWWT